MTSDTLESGSNRTPARAADDVAAAARDLVAWRRWYLGLPADRPQPGRLFDALEATVQALDARGEP